MKIINGNNSGLMDVKEAASYLKVRVSSIYQLTFKKKIPFVKIGRRNRFRKSDLDNFINKNVVEVIEG